jgi:fermentation-respiration switch protein FrsA (DUF1100 family)
MGKRFWRYGGFAVFITTTVLLVAGGCASRFFYYPDRNTYREPRQTRPPAEVVRFTSADGTSLTGWFVPAIGPAKGTVAHFHGNAQNLTAHFTFVDWLPGAGFNVFTFDYRGYGASAGAAERDGMDADGVAGLRYLASRPGVETNRIVVLGQSLGCAIALAAIAEQPCRIRAVALDSPFYSYRGIARDAMNEMPVIRWLRWPLSWAIIGNRRSPCNSLAHLPPMPIVIMHGTADGVIPVQHGRNLFAAAVEPKQLWLIEGGGHTVALLNPQAPYRRKLIEFFDAALTP